MSEERQCFMCDRGIPIEVRDGRTYHVDRLVSAKKPRRDGTFKTGHILCLRESSVTEDGTPTLRELLDRMYSAKEDLLTWWVAHQPNEREREIAAASIRSNPEAMAEIQRLNAGDGTPGPARGAAPYEPPAWVTREWLKTCTLDAKQAARMAGEQHPLPNHWTSVDAIISWWESSGARERAELGRAGTSAEDHIAALAKGLLTLMEQTNTVSVSAEGGVFFHIDELRAERREPAP